MPKFFLTQIKIHSIISECQRYRDIVQSVERWSPKPNVEGSSPSVPVQASEYLFRSFLFFRNTDFKIEERVIGRMYRKKVSVYGLLIMLVMIITGCTKVAQAETTKQSEEVRKTAENRLEAILESKKLVIGISPDYAPFAFIAREKEETYYAGSDIELGRYIAEQMGVEVEFCEMEFEECLEAVSEGRVDLVLLGMKNEKDREEKMDFTNVYYRPGTQVVLVKERQVDKLKTQDDFEEKTLAAQYGSLQAQLVVEQFPGSYLNLTENVSGAVLMLRTGSVDGVVLEEALAGEMLREYPELVRSEVEISYTPEDIVGGVEKGETELLERINEIINSVTEQNLYLHWIDEANKLAASM